LDLSIGKIADYLCSKIDMHFYSNPYDDLKLGGGKQNDLTFNMSCETFEYTDPEGDDTPLIGMHYYM
jgi:hypothetical protein